MVCILSNQHRNHFNRKYAPHAVFLITWPVQTPSKSLARQSTLTSVTLGRRTDGRWPRQPSSATLPPRSLAPRTHHPAAAQGAPAPFHVLRGALVRPRSSSAPRPSVRPSARPLSPDRQGAYLAKERLRPPFLRSFLHQSSIRALACRPSVRAPARRNACLPACVECLPACLPAIFPSLSDPQHSHVARRAGGETNACAPPPPPPSPPGPLSPPPPTSSSPPPPPPPTPPSGLSICSTCHPDCLLPSFLPPLPPSLPPSATAALSFSAM